MSGDGDLQIVLDKLSQLLGIPPPPVITPDELATGSSPISQLLRALGIAANAGDPADNEAAEAGHDERTAKTSDALTKFPANEQDASAHLAGLADSGQTGQMVQQMPQMASSIAGGIAGALGGLLQPLSQIPQQLGQAGQQAMQMGMGMLQHGVGPDDETAGEPFDPDGEFDSSGKEFGGSGGAGVGDGPGLTAPTAMLGPPPTPSAGTVPASSHVVAQAPPTTPEAASGGRAGMGAMPMMPPGGMHGAGGKGNESKPDTKRIVAPSVKNGAPVQGRITTPPPAPAVIKHVDGKPVATRRIVVTTGKRDEDEGADARR